VVDATGRMLEHTLLHLVQGDAAWSAAAQTLKALMRGTAPRPSPWATAPTAARPSLRARVLGTDAGVLHVTLVNESGASVYSASDVAREEFPDLDLTVRGAISIARRLQDPLAELVKVDPKSIGVGQYQHDVFQRCSPRSSTRWWRAA
jgi:uncharacterized protein